MRSIHDTGEAFLPPEQKLFARTVAFLPDRRAAGRAAFAILPGLLALAGFTFAVAFTIGFLLEKAS